MYIHKNTYIFLCLEQLHKLYHEKHNFASSFFYSVCFLRFIHVDTCQSNTFFWPCPLICINQFSIPVSLNKTQWLFSKPFWFSLFEGFSPRFFWLAFFFFRSQLRKVFQITLSVLPFLPTPNKWLLSFSCYLWISFISFTFHFLHLLIVWFLQEMVSPLRSGTCLHCSPLCFFHLYILKRDVTLAQSMPH